MTAAANHARTDVAGTVSRIPTGSRWTRGFSCSPESPGRWATRLALASCLVLLAGGSGADSLDNIAPTRDSYVNEQWPSQNYGSTSYVEVGDGASMQLGILLHYDVSAIPAGSTVTDAALVFQKYATDHSGSLALKLLKWNSAWTEGEVTWSSMGTPTMVEQVSLNADLNYPVLDTPGLAALVQEWIDTPSTNHGLGLFPVFLDHTITLFYSKENGGGLPVRLSVSYTPPPDVQLSNGVPYSGSITGISPQDAWVYHYIDVPSGATQLDVVLDNLSDDADLYVRFGAKPDLSTFDCRPYVGGTASETCSEASPAAGRWWVGVNNYAAGTINYRVTATYTVVGSYTLSVSKAGTGSGTVTSSPAGISCGSTCSASYASGSVVTLTATAAAGSTFAGWGGACSGTGTCSVTMTAARSVTATFDNSDFAAVFYTVSPCRILDSRSPDGPFAGVPLGAHQERVVQVSGLCGIPRTATAVAFNLTATEATAAGHIRIYPAGTATPTTSTINFQANVTRANNGVVMLGPGGDVALFSGQASGSVHVVIDVTGYFE
jgi:hypothetical protein